MTEQEIRQLASMLLAQMYSEMKTAPSKSTWQTVARAAMDMAKEAAKVFNE